MDHATHALVVARGGNKFLNKNQMSQFDFCASDRKSVNGYDVERTGIKKH